MSVKGKKISERKEKRGALLLKVWRYKAAFLTNFSNLLFINIPLKYYKLLFALIFNCYLISMLRKLLGVYFGNLVITELFLMPPAILQ